MNKINRVRAIQDAGAGNCEHVIRVDGSSARHGVFSPCRAVQAELLCDADLCGTVKGAKPPGPIRSLLASCVVLLKFHGTCTCRPRNRSRPSSCNCKGFRQGRISRLGVLVGFVTWILISATQIFQRSVNICNSNHHGQFL